MGRVSFEFLSVRLIVPTHRGEIPVQADLKRKRRKIEGSYKLISMLT